MWVSCIWTTWFIYIMVALSGAKSCGCVPPMGSPTAQPHPWTNGQIVPPRAPTRLCGLRREKAGEEDEMDRDLGRGRGRECEREKRTLKINASPPKETIDPRM